MTIPNLNSDTHEVAKFEALAHRWWDEHGEFKPLHEINPLRLQFITQQVELSGKKILDIGCGGGILTESMARLGGIVTGIDLAEAALKVAQLHSQSNGLSIQYHKITAEEFALLQPHQFDVITCMEMLEHVPDPQSIIQACKVLIRPQGHIFFSTFNRNIKAYLQAIIGAEYILNLLPRGTHDYAKFIKPSELAHWLRTNHLQLSSLMGMSYNPITRHYRLTDDVSVNYLAYCKDIYENS